MAKILILLMVAILPGPIQQSFTVDGGLANLSPFAGFIGLYLEAVKSPSVLSGLLDGSLLLTRTPWSAASVLMFWSVMSTSYRLTLWKMAELDLVPPHGPSAYRFRWLRFLRYLHADFFPQHRMHTFGTALRLINHFEAASIRQFGLAVDQTPHARTIPDRSSCLSLTRRALLNNFGHGGSNAAVLQEEQITRSSSNIATDLGKQISFGCPILPKRKIEVNSLTSQFEDLLRTRRLNDLADRSQHQYGHLNSLSSLSDRWSIVGILDGGIDTALPLAVPSRDCWREGPGYLSYNRSWPVPFSKPVSIGTASRKFSNPYKRTAFVPPREYANGRFHHVFDGPLRKTLQYLQYLYPAGYPKRISLQRAPNKGSFQRSRCPECVPCHCSWNSNGFWGHHEFDRHINDFHGNCGRARSEAWPWVAEYNVYYNAAAHLRRVYFDPKRKGFQRLNKSADDRQHQRGNHWSTHLKELTPELEDVVQLPLGISSLMDEPGPIAVAGMPTRPHGAEGVEIIWNVLSQTSNINSKTPKSRLREQDEVIVSILFGIRRSPGLRVQIQAVYDVLEAAWHSTSPTRDTVETSSQAGLLRQSTGLAYDAPPLTSSNLGDPTKLGYYLVTFLSESSILSLKKIGRSSRFGLDLTTSNDHLRDSFQTDGSCHIASRTKSQIPSKCGHSRCGIGFAL